MLLRDKGFYVSLQEEVPVQDPSRDRCRVVHVPIGNVLTTVTLLTLMHPGLAAYGGER
jgi:hypothetical protein